MAEEPDASPPPLATVEQLAMIVNEIRTGNLTHATRLFHLTRARMLLHIIDAGGGWNDELRRHWKKMRQFYS